MLCLMLAACGDDGDEAPAGGGTDLTVALYDGDELVESRTLDCDPGDDACARVAALLPELRPEPGEVCTEIYGGPERYVVDGTVDGVTTSVEVTRTNGCEIARFDRLVEALGPEGPAP